MTYATQSQLIDRVGAAMLIGLTNRGAAPLGAIDAAVMARALTDADEIINGYLARYTLPLATVPGLLADVAAAIALWKLHVTEPEAKIKADYEGALRTLRDIAQGVIRIPDAAGVEPATSGHSGVQIVDRARPLTEENMRGFI